MTDEIEQRIRQATDVFEKDVGTWDAEMVIHPGPGAPALSQKGVSVNRRIAGGRWLVTEWRSEGGFEGHGIYGWDESRGRYTGAWVDSSQTAIARSEGRWDAETRTMIFDTQVTNQGRPVRYRELTQTQPDGSLIYRNLIPLQDGSEFEMIRTVYRRRG